MNERIKELAEQAGIWQPTHDHKSWVRGEYIASPGELEKFARLIAKECAQLAMTEHHSTSPAEYDEMEPYEQGCDDTASAISGKIRRIFGVE